MARKILPSARLRDQENQKPENTPKGNRVGQKLVGEQKLKPPFNNDNSAMTITTFVN